MRIYLDCCCFQRPFDDQTQPRIKVETEAILAILAVAQSKDISLVNSEALEYEISRIPDINRQNEALDLLSLANEWIDITEQAEALADSFEIYGLQGMDAVHLALASIANVDFFCTCDDKFLKKAQSITSACKALSPLNLLLEITK